LQLGLHLFYDSNDVKSNEILRCDGCRQMGSPEHIARRLRRLEWATRYRPVHIQTLLLGAVAPRDDAEFLYAPRCDFRGEGEALLRAVGIPFVGKPAETAHGEFQSAGYFLTHILECPVEPDTNDAVSANARTDASVLLRKHLPAVASRIRRSLKPKRVTLVTEMPQELVQDILSLDLSCPVVLDNGKPFRFDSSTEGTSLSRFRELLAGAKGD
jgi:hypothetical protein